MMAELFAPPRAVEVSFSLEPAYNGIGSLSLLNMAKDFSGLGEWVYHTSRTLSPGQRRTNQLVLHDVHVHLADADWPSFGAWVDDLAAQDAATMRDRALQEWLAEVSESVGGPLPEPTALLVDRDVYLSLAHRFSQAKKEAFDRSFWQEMHGLLNDPVARQKLMVIHLRALWDELLAPEWERNLPVLQESVQAFESLDFSGLTALEALKRVVLRDLPSDGSMGWLSRLEQIIFMPSVHNGPYVVKLSGLSKTKVRIIFGARVPEGVSIRAPALSRSELLMRLNALSDDTRLRILELLGQQGEMGTPEIKALLDLSQSAASRHLEHLSATGYLTARRYQGTNLYQLNPERIDHTFRALKEFCQ